MADLRLDTTGCYLPTDTGAEEALNGRILLREDQMVCAESPNDHVSIPLDTVYDMSVTDPPPQMKGRAKSVVTIAYRHDGSPRGLTVAPSSRMADELADMLFEELIDGISVRILQSTAGTAGPQAREQGRLRLKDKTLHLNTAEPFRLSLDAIVDYQPAQYTVGDRKRPAVEICHQRGQETICTQIVLPSERLQHLLGRYFTRR